MSTKKETIKDDFFQTLEKGVRDVLGDAESSPEQKIQAINAGAKLMQIKHRISGTSDKDDSFFGGKK